MEKINCPSCGSASYKNVGEDVDRLTDLTGSFFLVECETCRLLYVNPRPSKEDLINLYPGNYPAYCETSLYGLYRRLRDFSLSKTIWKTVVSRLRVEREVDSGIVWLNSCSKILDFGCAIGVFLDHIRWLTGCDVYGIELNDTARRIASHLLGDTKVKKGINEGDFRDGMFDVVTMWYVLEHLMDPARSVKETGRLLKENGWLILGLPNYASWGRQFFGHAWSGLDLPRHLQFFSPETAKTFLEKHGFKIKKIKYPASTYNLIASIQILISGKRLLAGKKRSFFAQITSLIGRFVFWPFCVLAALFHKSDTMVVYAQKEEACLTPPCGT